LEAPYFVQWVTKLDDNNQIIRVVGYCVRDKDSFGWKTVFYHESADVCQKIADMLNEGENDGLQK
jgi:hypothetical protein